MYMLLFKKIIIVIDNTKKQSVISDQFQNAIFIKILLTECEIIIWMLL